MSDDKDKWREINRANWDERVGVHLEPGAYDVDALRSGQWRLHEIERKELGSVEGLKLIHLQCHFGRDTLALAQMGATVTGLDFSSEAIKVARALAKELKLEDRARFFESDLYAAPQAIPEPASFDRVFVTWGAINWLPDIRGWAKVAAFFLKPGGKLYLAEGHPAALVFDDLAGSENGRPGWFTPYFDTRGLVLDDERDYANADAKLKNKRTVEWMHPLGEVVTAIIDAGLNLDFLNEHDSVPWRMFECMEEQGDVFRFPDRPWLPLAFSLMATKR